VTLTMIMVQMSHVGPSALISVQPRLLVIFGGFLPSFSLLAIRPDDCSDPECREDDRSGCCDDRAVDRPTEDSNDPLADENAPSADESKSESGVEVNLHMLD
jgi:hypothetical protein